MCKLYYCNEQDYNVERAKSNTFQSVRFIVDSEPNIFIYYITSHTPKKDITIDTLLVHRHITIDTLLLMS